MMKRFLIGTAILVTSTLMFAQQAPAPAHVFSSDLIAWSFMQQPQEPEQRPAHQQPTPEPSPETKPAQNPTPAQPNAAQESPSQDQTPAAQTFTGTVSKEANSFVLKVSDTSSYKLDNQQQVQQYVGQRVHVIGTLDRSINLIHVDRIEPIS